MKAALRKSLFTILLAVILLPPIAYWAADAWLESAGGRRMIETELGGRIGMPVRLEGEFDLMLLPDIGVSGTGLHMGGAGGETEFAHGREYEISVALKPLFQRQVRIDWIRLTGGEIRPAHYQPAGLPKTGDSAPGFRLPEIRELTVRDFNIVPADDGGRPIHITELTVNDFAEGRETPFALKLEELGSVHGRFNWTAGRALVRLSGLRIMLAGQSATGTACLRVEDPVSIHAELEAGILDGVVEREGMPVAAGAGDGGGVVAGIDIRARLSARQLLGSGAVAHDVVFSIGGEPDCN